MNEHADAWVELNEMELILGGLAGVMRAAAAITAGRRNRAAGIDDDGRIWTRHVEGALGEIAASKALDLCWTGAAGAGSWRATKAAGGDVGRLQVRLRIADPEDQVKRLIIQQRDRDDETFLLVVGRAPAYRIVGWFRAGDAKRHPEWIQNPGNFGEAWFVPQASLHPLWTLETRGAA